MGYILKLFLKQKIYYGKILTKVWFHLDWVLEQIFLFKKKNVEKLDLVLITLLISTVYGIFILMPLG